jgi:hypothetical protein
MLAHLTVKRQSTVQSSSFSAYGIPCQYLGTVGCHLGWHSTAGWPLRGGRGTTSPPHLITLLWFQGTSRYCNCIVLFCIILFPAKSVFYNVYSALKYYDKGDGGWWHLLTTSIFHSCMRYLHILLCHSFRSISQFCNSDLARGRAKMPYTSCTFFSSQTKPIQRWNKSFSSLYI